MTWLRRLTVGFTATACLLLASPVWAQGVVVQTLEIGCGPDDATHRRHASGLLKASGNGDTWAFQVIPIAPAILTIPADGWRVSAGGAAFAAPNSIVTDWGGFHVSSSTPAKANDTLTWTGTPTKTGSVKVKVVGTRACGGGGGGGAGGAPFDNSFDAEWDVDVTGTLKGIARACAGAVLKADGSPDGVHSFTLAVSSDPKTRLDFSFEGNVGHPKVAQFIGPANAQSITLSMNTDAAGNGSLTILSSDTISMPDLVVKKAGVEFTRVTCDFAAAEAKRRFGIQDFVTDGSVKEGYAEDTGWDVSQVLTQEGELAAATLYLKFRPDISKAIDPDYYITANPHNPNLRFQKPIDYFNPRRHYSNIAKLPAEFTDVDAAHPENNVWKPVAGHVLHVSIASISTEVISATYAPVNGHKEVSSSRSPVVVPAGDATLQDYVLFCDAGGRPVRTDAVGNPLFDDTAGNHLGSDADGNPVDPATGKIVPNAVLRYISPTTDPTMYATNPITGITRLILAGYHFPRWVPATTDANGVATIYLTGSTMVHRTTDVKLQAVDQTQFVP